jgi:DNA-binding LytR/AlgR family response regulator
MKIAVFENEYESVRGAFEASNLLDFSNNLKIDVYPSSQSAQLNEISDYSVIFIDIDLSAKSQLDGFALIQKILSLNDTLKSKIVILTGNNRIEEILKERGIYSSQIRIIIKPTNYLTISNAINGKSIDS